MSSTEVINYDGAVTSLQFDSRKVIAAAGDNAVKVSVRSASSNALLVFYASDRKRFCQIYNRTTRQLSSLSTNGHTKSVQRLRYMDKYLVSGGCDATVKIWAL